MTVRFEPMGEEHASEVIDIFNYYVEHSFAAFPEEKLPYGFFARMLEAVKGYPAYVMKKTDGGRVVGFCLLRAYNPLPVFRETAEIGYFIDKDEVGGGLGKKALALLESEAKKMGIKNLLACIFAGNTQSIAFHAKNGFTECGRFKNVGRKKGQAFDVVWMGKEI